MKKQVEKSAAQSVTSGDAVMRLDKFLKISRIIKRRSVANEACDTGHVMLNGKAAKPGADVRVGDILSVRYGDRLTQYEILSLKEHVLKNDAAELYRLIP